MLTGDYQTLIYKQIRAGQTLHDVLFNTIGLSARLYRKLKKQRAITVNGHAISVNAKLRPGDEIVVRLIEDEHRIVPQQIPLDIVYEDCDIVAVNKAVGIVAHPTLGVPDQTLANALRHYALSQSQDYKPRLINRLDRDTSGIILFAKNAYAQHRVSREFIENRIEKYYTALAHGKFNRQSATIEAPIGLAEHSQIVRTVRDDGKRAVTHYQVLKQLHNVALLRIKIDTGRTHQIRVHLSHMGHPLVGDDLYGSFEAVAIARQALHASELHLMTPRCGHVVIRADLPADMVRACQILA